MSGIETADMNPHTLDQGQLRLTTDSKSVEDLPSLLHTWPSRPPLLTTVDQPSVLQECIANGIRRTSNFMT
jgi:hypothetical protein